MQFWKYQGLGNDYIILVAGAGDPEIDEGVVRRICDRHYGIGSDGILLETPASSGRIGLRIINPDGSEAEKSGNGLRIFSRYLWDRRRVGPEPFEVSTLGGVVRCQVRDEGRTVFVEMGRASFDAAAVPVAGFRGEVVGETLQVLGERLSFTGVTVGNPHCVIHVDDVSEGLARRLGPHVEAHPVFPNRTNVQFVRVIDRHRIRIEIWERGAGYTLASGSSSCAAAAASVRLGLCEGDVTVEMPGGTLSIEVGPDYDLTMLGPVGGIASGTVADDLLTGAA